LIRSAYQPIRPFPNFSKKDIYDMNTQNYNAEKHNEKGKAWGATMKNETTSQQRARSG
jgi:hypothetical protein